jgi:hypothetical protein
MTAATDVRQVGGAEATLVVLARDVLSSEWTKVRSVRSTMWSLLIAAVTALGGSVILAFSAAREAKQPFDSLASIYLAWLEYPVLAMGILAMAHRATPAASTAPSTLGWPIDRPW